MKRHTLRLFCSVIATLLLSSNTNAQQPYGEIEARHAQDRIDIYKNSKKPVLDRMLDDMKEEDIDINVPRNDYRAMIREFADPGLQFTGFRVYFAQSLKSLSNPENIDERRNKLTLVFVPTKADGKKQKDQEDYFYYIKYGSAIPITLVKVQNDEEKRQVKKEIERYQLTRLPALEKAAARDEDLDLTGFVETKNIWYNIFVLNYNDGTTMGLFFYLETVPGQKVDYVDIHFAARTMDEQFEHHLDIVSELHYTNQPNPTYVGFGSVDIKNFGLKEFKDFYLDEIRNLPEDFSVKCLTSDQNAAIEMNVQKLKSFSFTEFEFEDTTSFKQAVAKLQETFSSIKCFNPAQKKVINSKIDGFAKIILTLASSYVDTGNPCPTKKCSGSVAEFQ